MNQGAVKRSPVQQMVAAGSPNWWSINNMRPPPHQHQHHSFSSATPQLHFPHHQPTPPEIASSSWSDNQELSWVQLILGGSVSEEDKPVLSHHMQAKELENWEQHFLNHNSNISEVDLNQESFTSSYTFDPRNMELLAAKPATIWSSQMVSASSPKSCITNLSSNILDSARRSSDEKHHADLDPSSECNSTATGGAAKKARIQPSPAMSTFKVRKEKLGDRITALHQIVSPFGKTDTASVLSEAIGYIRFLQSQIEALSLPYLGSKSRNMNQQHPVQVERNCLFPEDPGQLLNEKCMKRKAVSDLEPKNLRSRGLCLVPTSCIHVGSENGADYWAPAFSANFQ